MALKTHSGALQGGSRAGSSSSHSPSNSNLNLHSSTTSTSIEEEEEEEWLAPSLFLLDPRLEGKGIGLGLGPGLSLGLNDFQWPLDALIPFAPSVYGDNDHNYIDVKPVTSVSSKEFLALIKEVRRTIEAGRYLPLLVKKGSSGSYFCRDSSGKIRGIFKPKDEEPYGQMNPKWTKWLHRTLLPCCFGRSCIIPNSGYLSEAAAAFVDQRLGLNIVPRTEIIRLSSPSFHYSLRERLLHKVFKRPLPEKIGSFQIFLEGYLDSTTFFQDGYTASSLSPTTSSIPPSSLTSTSTLTNFKNPSTWPDLSRTKFQLGFEKLVVLDYFIRSTDRGSDNWMISLSPPSTSPSQTLGSSTSTILIDIETPPSTPPSKSPQSPTLEVQIAAIDNGLAFPTHHPNRVRTYPYGWLLLPIVHTPFHPQTARLLLPLLTSSEWWTGTLEGIERLFRLDPDFKEEVWRRQKSLIRGQGFNLMDVLSLSRIMEVSPFELVQRPLVIIHEDYYGGSESESGGGGGGGNSSDFEEGEEVNLGEGEETTPLIEGSHGGQTPSSPLTRKFVSLFRGRSPSPGSLRRKMHRFETNLRRAFFRSC